MAFKISNLHEVEKLIIYFVVLKEIWTSTNYSNHKNLTKQKQKKDMHLFKVKLHNVWILKFIFNSLFYYFETV